MDVVGLGCSCIDILEVVSRIPGVDEELEAIETKYQGGGEVATALVTLAKLGSSTGYIGKVGDDFIGQMIKDDLEMAGVDVSDLVVERGAISLASVVLVDNETGKRTIISGRSTVSDLKPSELNKESIKNAKFILLDGTDYNSAIETANIARSSSVIVVLDADISSSRSESANLIKLTDIVIASEAFALSFSSTDDIERAAATISDIGSAVTVVTLGERGSLCYYNGNSFHTPSFGVDVVDTTGAGDVFHGAFIHGMNQGWGLKKIIRFASAVSSIKCTKLGGRTGIPTFTETMEFMDSRIPD